MWLPFSIGIGLFTLLGLGLRKALGGNSAMSINVDMTDKAITRWEPYAKIAGLASGIPWEFIMAYLGVESTGNPCAVGELTARGPDGAPREIGLFQLYNPDDLRALKTTGSELRAYCVKPAPGNPDPQRLARPMTDEEIGRHIGLGVGNIKRHRYTIDQLFSHLGVKIAPSARDYWRFVKLVHALPVLVNPGIANVTKKLGRPVLSWTEYRNTYAAINPLAKFNPSTKKQTAYYRALENAEWTGSQVTDRSLPSDTGDVA